jgi:PAS domain S-box-containing protein
MLAIDADSIYRLLVDAITDYAIYMLDNSGAIISWNQGARRFKGYEESEVLGKHFSIFYTDEERRSQLPKRALETAAKEGTFESEGWRLRKDGNRFWAHVVIDPVRDQTGRIIGFAKITRDLSQNRRVKQKLRESEDQLRLLLQGALDHAIYLLSPDGFITSWNIGAERMKGYLPDEIIGSHFSTFFTVEDQEKGEPMRSLDVANREGRFEKQGWRVRKDGSLFFADVVINPIRDAEGAVVGFAKVTRDMTKTMQAQQNLDRAREALFQSQKMEAIGQLTAGVAHDFNNILMVVLGGLEVIQRRMPPNPSVSPLLESAMQSARRGKALTQRMLAFARRRDDFKPELIELPDLVHGMSDLLRRTLGPSIVIDIQIDRLPGQVQIDRNEFELALINLLMNARDAMPDGGTVVIAANEDRSVPAGVCLSTSDRYICVSVADQGEGMDEQTLFRAREPFFTTKDVGKGTGLGLSMVHGFAERSGGQLIVKSRKGVGTVAELWLPLIVDPIQPQIRQEEVLQMDLLLERMRATRPTSVLVVSDDRLSLMNLASTLNSLGHRTFAAFSGEAALSLIWREPAIDHVIIDESAPKVRREDFSVFPMIRMEWPTLPVIFVAIEEHRLRQWRQTQEILGERELC